MRQLPLDITLADYAVFDSYHAGPNGAAVYRLTEASHGRAAGLTWLWGDAGSGRSHLLQAVVAVAGNAAYLPLGLSGLVPAALDGLASGKLVCLDDVDLVAGQRDWERALFLTFEETRQRGIPLVVAASCPPASAGFELVDLTSRFSSGATFRLQPLDENEMLAALSLRAKWRGFELPTATARYLLTHTERQAASLFGLFDKLVAESLEAGRRLTVPFVKETLNL